MVFYLNLVVLLLLLSPSNYRRHWSVYVLDKLKLNTIKKYYKHIKSVFSAASWKLCCPLSIEFFTAFRVAVRSQSRFCKQSCCSLYLYFDNDIQTV